jgi:hypothetical protein
MNTVSEGFDLAYAFATQNGLLGYAWGAVMVWTLAVLIVGILATVRGMVGREQK